MGRRRRCPRSRGPSRCCGCWPRTRPRCPPRRWRASWRCPGRRSTSCSPPSRRPALVTHLPEERTYGLGVGVFELGSAYLRNDPLERLSRPLLVGVVGQDPGHRPPRGAARGRDPLPAQGAAPAPRDVGDRRGRTAPGAAHRRRPVDARPPPAGAGARALPVRGELRRPHRRRAGLARRAAGRARRRAAPRLGRGGRARHRRARVGGGRGLRPPRAVRWPPSASRSRAASTRRTSGPRWPRSSARPPAGSPVGCPATPRRPYLHGDRRPRRVTSGMPRAARAAQTGRVPFPAFPELTLPRLPMPDNPVSRTFRRIVSGEPEGRPAWVAALEDGDDAGLYGPGSAPWVVHGSLTTLVGGIRALLLQTLHPAALAGVQGHSRYREDALGRLTGTARWLVTVTFGDSTAVERESARVRGHARQGARHLVGAGRPDRRRHLLGPRPRAAALGARRLHRLVPHHPPAVGRRDPRRARTPTWPSGRARQNRWG